jgi:hypothetical protein
MRTGTFQIQSYRYLPMLHILGTQLSPFIYIYSEHYQKIVDHLLSKLEVAAFEWRRIQKSLTAVEFIMKNGPPRLAMDLKHS